MKGSGAVELGLYFLYNLLLLILLPVAILILAWRLLIQGSYRKGVLERFGLLPGGVGLRTKGQKLFWVHAVSVGEVLASVPLLRAIKNKFPKDRLILSTVTVTGREIARQKIPDVDVLIYYPYDLPWVSRWVVNQISPDLFIFLETELWPNFLRSLKKRGIPSLMVNGRISPKSFRHYRWGRWFFRVVLRQISFFSVQTDRDVGYLRDLGADPLAVECMGNIKYDQDFEVFDEERLNFLRKNLGVDEEKLVFVVGSTHEGEETLILDHFKEMTSRWGPFVMILAPRHLNRLPSIEGLLEQRGIPYIRKSEQVSLSDDRRSDLSVSTVILLDTLGELAAYYRLATVVFVGGSLVPIGGHNILEPAAYGKVSFFGPYMHNFSEISRLMKERGGGIEVENVQELVSKMELLLKNCEALEQRGREAQKVVLENRGAVKKNMGLIERFIGS